jgi:predicted amidohydrolase
MRGMARPSPKNPIRVALAQASPAPGDLDANARAAATTIARAAERGAQLVVFPELFLTGYELAHLAKTKSAWLEESDARLDPIRRACSDTGATAILGAPLRTRAGAQHIAAPIVGPRGDVEISCKEYVHGSEAELFVSGAPIPPFEAHGWRVAVAICFDTAHPRHAERAAQDGADLYVSSALYFKGEERRCDLHLGARAMDNRFFAVLANYAGSSGGYESLGASGAWSPRGDVIARVDGAGEALLVVDLDPALLAQYRSR